MMKFLFPLSLLFGALSLQAQFIDPSDYLKSYRNQTGFQSFDQYDQRVGDLRFGLPVVDEFNFRTETDQFNLSRQEYALRVMFNGWGAGSAYAKEKAWLQNKIQTSKLRYGSNLLLQRYEDLCELYFLEQQLLVDQADSLLADSMVLVVVKNLMADEENNLGDVINWENKKAESQRKLNEHRFSLFLQRQKMKVGDNRFQWVNWVGPESMKQILEVMSIQDLYALDVKDFEADSSLINHRWQTSKNNDHKILDFAQLRYSKRDNLLFQDEFSIGVGFRLPYKGTQKRQGNEFKLDMLKIQQEKMVQQEEKINAFNNEYYQFLFLYHQWSLLADEPKQASLLNENNPIVGNALKLEKDKKAIEKWNKRLEVEKKLTLQYLNTLHVGGAFENNSSTNFLSTLLPSF